MYIYMYVLSRATSNLYLQSRCQHSGEVWETDVMGVLGFKQQVFGGTGGFVLPRLIAYIHVEEAGKYFTCWSSRCSSSSI